MKKIILVLALLAMTVGISACNTVEGLGRDVEVAGEKIQSL
ncbi:MAG: entericidin A/B family lipoprotein [Pseudomonadota bacterium]|jgi:predicted small secreted protein|nr:entericidin A/B family lipoprotein [Pseudomonadota bacterium]MEC8666143.1 entericidin A/B family lipoprotein [Pseudomonadota bacterium]